MGVRSKTKERKTFDRGQNCELSYNMSIYILSLNIEKHKNSEANIYYILWEQSHKIGLAH
jgi:hypothetical protein